MTKKIRLKKIGTVSAFVLPAMIPADRILDLPYSQNGIHQLYRLGLYDAGL